MSKSPAASPQPAPKRNPALVALDLSAGFILGVIALFIGLAIVGVTGSYSGILKACGAGPYEGMVCNEGYLSTVVFIITAIAIFAFAIPAGMFVVNAIRKRTAWYWPLIGIVISVVAFYAGTYFASLAAPTL